MKNIIICVVLLLTNNLVAQDLHFSNYNMAPLTLSPALTGMMEGNHRLVTNYREQWASFLDDHAYKTIGASYDMRFCGRKDFGGIGIKALADRSGSKNYSVYNIGLTGAYSKSLGDAGNLSIGVETGLIRHEVDIDQFKFEQQFDGFYYDSSLPNNENFNSDGYTFFDISAGLMWYNANRNLFAGIALHHINNPNYSFEDLTFPLNAEVDMKLTMHLSSIILLGASGRFGILPRGVVQVQGNQWQLLAGVDHKFGFGDAIKNVLYLGVAARVSGHNDNFMHTDAVVVTSRFDFDRYAFGLSYDFNVSSLRKASNFRGALELSGMFIFSDGAGTECLDCPRWY